jgi:hypothetical protein
MSPLRALDPGLSISMTIELISDRALTEMPSVPIESTTS